MRNLYSCYVLLVTILVSAPCAFAERRPLEKPDLDFQLGDTSLDNEVMNKKTGKYEPLGSEATVEYDAENRIYTFRFKEAPTEWWYTITWWLRSNVDVIVTTEAKWDKALNKFVFTYQVERLKSSAYRIRAIYLEMLNTATDLDTAPLDLKKMALEKTIPESLWHGKHIDKRSEHNLWAWRPWNGYRYQHSPGPHQRIHIFRIASDGLPTPDMCWVTGFSPDLTYDPIPEFETELPSSIEQELSKKRRILSDAVSGLTISPGANTVELPKLQEYLDVSIAQGWLEKSKALDQFKVIIAELLRLHNTAQAIEVLDESSKTQHDQALKNVIPQLQRLYDYTQEVYKKKDTPLLSEAYSLFHFNTEYLFKNYIKNETKQIPEDKDAKNVIEDSL